MKKTSLLTIALLPAFLSSIAQVKVQGLLTENLSDPIGLDSRAPRFSWQLTSPQRDVSQTAYELFVSSNRPTGDVIRIVWNSGKVASGESLHVPYGGPALRSGEIYYWRVRVWDNKGQVSDWSRAAFWRTGLFEPGDWKAKWIAPGFDEGPITATHTDRPSPLFRKTFGVNKKIRSAILYITAHGMYEAKINGQRIGNAYLTPGWTSYNKRLQYQCYDVTSLVNKGNNAIGVILGNGWYRGYIGFNGQKNFYGKDISLLCQLDLTYTDGSTGTVVSDDSWRSTTGAIRDAEIYDGEVQDARQEKRGFDGPGYSDGDWSGVRTESFPMDNLIASASQPVRKHETFTPVRIFTSPRGEKLIDFGQNLVGWVMITVKGHAGDTVRISHAEVLDKSGNFYTANLRAAEERDTYILSGNGEEHFEPHFTFHGFRYIRVEGLRDEPTPDQFTAVALYSDMPETGTFHTSDALLNQLQHNIQWGQKGNFLDVPTDCPQRDERLGWTGDAQVFSRTAAYNRGVESFFAKWLKDVAADQFSSGSVPYVIPNVLGTSAGGSTGWADVCTIIPWNVYLAYGDKRVLEDQYPSMRAWVEYMHAQSHDDLWNTGFHFGDWLFYRPQDDNDGLAAVTDKYLIAQCFYAHSTQLLIDAATVLGKVEDSISYSALEKRIKDAFLREYVTPNGRLISGTQTAYVLALQFDMLPSSLRPQAAQRLAANVKFYKDHLTTGFLGTPYLCHVLTRYGYDSLAFRLLMQDSYPSWLYPVKMGATTIWERWDGIRPDSSFQTPGMNSFNHYAYGAIGDWMYRVIAGIDTYRDGAGYKHSCIRPHIGGGLTSADGELQTGYGPLGSSWKLTGEGLLIDLVIPPNTSSRVFLPVTGAGNADEAAARITESGKPLGSARDLHTGNWEDGYLAVDLGSGTWHFRIASR